MDAALPDDVRRLLWDVDPETADAELHWKRIFERVMTRGTLEAMVWLMRRYDRERLRDYVHTVGSKSFPPRELAFWSVVLGLEVPRRARGPGGGRPVWAD